MKCEICGKEYSTLQALNSHKGWHNKPDRVSNFVEYGKKVKNGEVERLNTNQHTKAKNEGRICEVSDITRKKIGDATRIANNIYWSSEENRKKQSIAMKKAVIDNPDSYSLKNVSGRVKSYDFVDSYGNKTKLKGKWEVKVAEFLNEKNIGWTNIVSPTSYYWNDDWHLYFPDFYLKEYNLYLEVKGYERDRDKCKWSHFPFELLKIKLTDINDLDKWFSKNLVKNLLTI
jgi:hypothetical protein